MNTTDKKLLVLDLDETLIHATSHHIDQHYHFSIDKYCVYKRPYLKEFLEKISLDYNVAIWSSANEIYIDKIIDLAGINQIDLKFIWGRKKCSTRRNLDLDIYVHEKRLKKLKKAGYQLEQILIVDDSPEKLIDNYGNAIYIRAFEGNSNDAELEKLLYYLQTIKEVANVRNIEKRAWSK